MAKIGDPDRVKRVLHRNCFGWVSSVLVDNALTPRMKIPCLYLKQIADAVWALEQFAREACAANSPLRRIVAAEWMH